MSVIKDILKRKDEKREERENAQNSSNANESDSATKKLLKREDNKRRGLPQQANSRPRYMNQAQDTDLSTIFDGNQVIDANYEAVYRPDGSLEKIQAKPVEYRAEYEKDYRYNDKKKKWVADGEPTSRMEKYIPHEIFFDEKGQIKNEIKRATYVSQYVKEPKEVSESVKVYDKEIKEFKDDGYLRKKQIYDTYTDQNIDTTDKRVYGREAYLMDDVDYEKETRNYREKEDRTTNKNTNVDYKTYKEEKAKYEQQRKDAFYNSQQFIHQDKDGYVKNTSDGLSNLKGQKLTDNQALWATTNASNLKENKGITSYNDFIKQYNDMKGATLVYNSDEGKYFYNKITYDDNGNKIFKRIEALPSGLVDKRDKKGKLEGFSEASYKVKETILKESEKYKSIKNNEYLAKVNKILESEGFKKAKNGLYEKATDFGKIVYDPIKNEEKNVYSDDYWNMNMNDGRRAKAYNQIDLKTGNEYTVYEYDDGKSEIKNVKFNEKAIEKANEYYRKGVEYTSAGLYDDAEKAFKESNETLKSIGAIEYNKLDNFDATKTGVIEDKRLRTNESFADNVYNLNNIQQKQLEMAQGSENLTRGRSINLGDANVNMNWYGLPGINALAEENLRLGNEGSAQSSLVLNGSITDRYNDIGNNLFYNANALKTGYNWDVNSADAKLDQFRNVVGTPNLVIGTTANTVLDESMLEKISRKGKEISNYIKDSKMNIFNEENRKKNKILKDVERLKILKETNPETYNIYEQIYKESKENVDDKSYSNILLRKVQKINIDDPKGGYVDIKGNPGAKIKKQIDIDVGYDAFSNKELYESLGLDKAAKVATYNDNYGNLMDRSLTGHFAGIPESVGNIPLGIKGAMNTVLNLRYPITSKATDIASSVALMTLIASKNAEAKEAAKQEILRVKEKFDDWKDYKGYAVKGAKSIGKFVTVSAPKFLHDASYDILTDPSIVLPVGGFWAETKGLKSIGKVINTAKSKSAEAITQLGYKYLPEIKDIPLNNPMMLEKYTQGLRKEAEYLEYEIESELKRLGTKETTDRILNDVLKREAAKGNRIALIEITKNNRRLMLDSINQASLETYRRIFPNSKRVIEIDAPANSIGKPKILVWNNNIKAQDRLLYKSRAAIDDTIKGVKEKWLMIPKRTHYPEYLEAFAQRFEKGLYLDKIRGLNSKTASSMINAYRKWQANNPIQKFKQMSLMTPFTKTKYIRDGVRVKEFKDMGEYFGTTGALLRNRENYFDNLKYDIDMNKYKSDYDGFKGYSKGFDDRKLPSRDYDRNREYYDRKDGYDINDYDRSSKDRDYDSRDFEKSDWDKKDWDKEDWHYDWHDRDSNDNDMMKGESSNYGLKGFQTMYFDDLGRMKFGRVYKSKEDAIKAGMRDVDENGEKKFTIREIDVKDKSEFAKAQDYNKLYKFKTTSNSYERLKKYTTGKNNPVVQGIMNSAIRSRA